jgi:hypothetical protein
MRRGAADQSAGAAPDARPWLLPAALAMGVLPWWEFDPFQRIATHQLYDALDLLYVAGAFCTTFLAGRVWAGFRPTGAKTVERDEVSR